MYIPDIIPLSYVISIRASGNPFKCHEEFFLYLQPLIPPKRFDIFSSLTNVFNVVFFTLTDANPAVNTPRPSRGTRIESCDFIVLIGDP